MEGEASKEALGAILMQAMSAAKNVRAQRDRILQLRRRLQQLSPGDGDAARVKELAGGLFSVYFKGLECGSRYLQSCLRIAAESGARLELDPAFAVIPDEQLYDVLLAQWLPARPTTQAQAYSRIEAALYAVKLPEEHHIPRCIELLVGARPPNVTGEPLLFGGMTGYSDDPVAAAHKHIAKTGGLPCPVPLAPADAATGKPPQVASSRDLDQALSYLHRACSLTSLAVKHIDLAVAVISSFLDPKEVAGTSEMVDQFTYISEDGPYPSD